MNDKLLIPEKVKIGYQERRDTYTKKLAYVIYYDTKGVLRKETSWQSWRDKKIDFDDYENVPTEGFVLNRGVGGQRQSYGWNARNEYIRVYDPRGFEFEISVANLLFILQECTSSKGKGLEGEFVYSWSGKELVLLPVNSQEYKVSTEFTDLQTLKIGAKDLKPGCSYLMKDMSNVTYLGRFMYYKTGYDSRNSYDLMTSAKKGHVFHTGDDPKDGFTHFKSMAKIAKLNSDVEVSNYADLMDGFNKSKHSSGTIDMVSEPLTIDFDKIAVKNYWGDTRIANNLFISNQDGTYDMITISEENEKRDGKVKLKGYTIEFNKTYRMTPKGLVVKSSEYRDESNRYYGSNRDRSVINHPSFRNFDKIEFKYNSNGHWNSYSEYYLTKEQINSVEYSKLRIKLANGKLAKPTQFSINDY